MPPGPEPPRSSPRLDLAILSGASSAAALFATMAVGAVEGYLLHRTSQFGEINEGNAGCFWYLAALPTVFVGYGVGGVSAVVALVAGAIAVRSRSPIVVLALAALAAGIALIALSRYGQVVVLEVG